MPLNFHENKVALFDMCPRDLLKNSSSEDGLFIGTHLCSLPVILLRRKKDRLVLRIRLFMYFVFCILYFSARRHLCKVEINLAIM